MSNINFTGTYIKPEAAIIELGKEDADSFIKVADDWDSWITNLITAHFFEPKPKKPSKFYALSTQERDFGCMEPSKVLAFFEIEDAGKKYLMPYLDVHPEYRKNPNDTTNMRTGFSQVGKACIDFIREKFAKVKPTEFFSVESAISFYKKTGCKKIPSKKYDNKFMI